MPERRHTGDRGGMQWRGSTRTRMQFIRPFRGSHPFCGTADSPMVPAAPTDHRKGMWRRGSYGTATGTHPFCGTRSTMAQTGRRGMRRRVGYGSTHPFCGTGGPYIHLVGSSSTLVGG